MLNTFWLLLICAILPTQIIICSRQPERHEIYDKIAAMLRGECRLNVTGTTTLNGEPLYPSIPTNHLAITDKYPHEIESITSEESLLGNGLHTPCFTLAEADALIEQSTIPQLSHKFTVLRFLMTGKILELPENRAHCTLSTAAERSAEPTPLKLSYMHKNNDGHHTRVTLFTIEQRQPPPPNTQTRTESPISNDWVLVPYHNAPS